MDEYTEKRKRGVFGGLDLLLPDTLSLHTDFQQFNPTMTVLHLGWFCWSMTRGNINSGLILSQPKLMIGPKQFTAKEVTAQ
nr:uncharacterized protein LOC101497338 isoform X5 [Cicer arietinum]